MLGVKEGSVPDDSDASGLGLPFAKTEEPDSSGGNETEVKSKAVAETSSNGRMIICLFIA